jgi:uncharacterized protein YdeI (YjbR/CyaY-like superfamily)
MSPFQNEPGVEDQLHFADRTAWRAWLEENHDTRDSVWLIFHKKHSATESIDYESAVLEALCFGWIDSRVQSMDEDRYRQYYSRRKPTSNWNGANKRRVARLRRDGLMTPAGEAAIAAAKETGSWEFLDDVEAMVLPDDLADALARHEGARGHYEDFSNTKKQAVLMWVKQAKRAATRADRIAKVAEAAARGETPFDYL